MEPGTHTGRNTDHTDGRVFRVFRAADTNIDASADALAENGPIADTIMFIICIADAIMFIISCSSLNSNLT